MLALLLLVAVAACGSSESTGAPKAVATSSTTAEEARAIDGPVMRYPDASSRSGNLSRLLDGVLQLDGDCLYLVQDAIGERFPILWPAGTRWDVENQSVVSPDGEVMRTGTPLKGRGGFFYVSDVNLLAGGAASNRATTCVDNTYRQIAVAENTATAIRAK